MLNVFLAFADRLSKILVSVVMSLLVVLVVAMLYEVVSRRVFVEHGLRRRQLNKQRKVIPGWSA